MQDDPRSGPPKTQRTDANVDITNLVALRSKNKCESNSRRIEYEQGNSVTDCKGKFGNEKNFRKNGASNLDT